MVRTQLKDMNLLDDFLFWALMSNEEYGPIAAQYMLETILQQPIGEVEVHTQKVLYGVNEKFHGIRIDAFVTDTGSPLVTGNMYDLEPDKNSAEKEALPFRTRYYHTMIDNRCLKSGDDYKNLRKSYVIMITSFDPFTRNRMMYTIKNRCVEEPDLPYEDGAFTIFIYVNGKTDGMPENLVHLLHYMTHTSKENAVGNLVSIHSMVEKIKQDKEVQKAEMKWREIIEYERKEAREEGREEGRKEEQAKYLREKQRADEAEQQIEKLKKEIAELRKHG